MKKIISILLVGLLMLQGVAFADYQLGTENDELTLKGVANPYETVSVILLNSDTFECENAEDTVTKYYDNIDNDVVMTNNEIFYYNTVVADDEGAWELVVPMPDIDKVDLTLVATDAEAEYIRYVSVAFRTNIIPTLKLDAAPSDDYTKLAETIEYYIDYITDSAAMFKDLKNKDYVAQFCAPVIAGLSEDSESLTKLKNILNKAIYITAISEGKITDFEEVMYFDYDEDAVESSTETGKEKMIELLQGKKYTSEEMYIKEAKFQIALQSFNYSSNRSGDYLLDKLLEANEVIGLDLDEFDDLSKSNKPKAAKKLADKKCENLKDAQDYLDDIVEDYEEKSSGGSGGGGGGGSVSGSIPYSGSSSTSISNQYVQEQKYIYSDMSLSPWAADAIVYLADKKIVNGYIDGTFKPTAPITRAEFTKIVVEAFYGIIAYEFENQFTDVPDNAWYAPYVNKAYEEGIISGTGNGEFCPNDTITRQDMAVILYNASVKHNLISEVTNYRAFGDDSTISAYAKSAVYTLKDNGIINGVGESTFSPLTNADRASACQMLYTLMIKSTK